MKQIERNMLEAIRKAQNWKQGNTKVVPKTDSLGTATGDCSVYLHNNLIANTLSFSYPMGISVNLAVLMRYPTRVTMSRLKALNVNVSTRNGNVYIGKDLICSEHPYLSTP